MSGVSFDRIISVDWSGAGKEREGVALRVSLYDHSKGNSAIVPRYERQKDYKSWSRACFREWLGHRLKKEEPRTLVAMDFGFGLPWNADSSVFRVNGWERMIRQISRIYGRFKLAGLAAKALNNARRFRGNGGPYRFDDGRSDVRFYSECEVGYFRLTELGIPQAVSQWYMGSGTPMGFHTMTGLSAIHYLIQHRDKYKQIDFDVWPRETLTVDGSRHVLAESYPAITPLLACEHCGMPYTKRSRKKKYVRRQCTHCQQCGRWEDNNEEDAWRVLTYLVNKQVSNDLSSVFNIKPVPFGRYKGVPYLDQIQFEGYILGS